MRQALPVMHIRETLDHSAVATTATAPRILGIPSLVRQSSSNNTELRFPELGHQRDPVPGILSDSLRRTQRERTASIIATHALIIVFPHDTTVGSFCENFP